MKTKIWMTCVLAVVLCHVVGCRAASMPNPYDECWGKPDPGPEVLARYDRPDIDWTQAEKKVVCTIMLNYGTADGPTGEYACWQSSTARPDVVTDPATGRRDMPMLYQPLSGPYDTKDPKTMKFTMDMADRMGLDAWAVWYWPPLDGPSEIHRDNMKLYMDYIEEHDRRVKMCAVIDVAFFPIGVELGVFESWGAEDVIVHIEYVLEHFGKRPSYFTYEGRPVLFIYDARALGDISKWDYVLRRIRHDGYDPIIIAQVHPEVTPEVCAGGEEEFRRSGGEYNQRVMGEVFDGGFDIFQIGFGPWKDHDRAEVWNAAARYASEHNALYLPHAAAGYHTYLWVPESWTFEVPRRDGQHYADTWKDAIDSGSRWVFLACWNEWYEHTQLEPAIEYGYLYVDLTREWIEKFRADPTADNLREELRRAP